MLPRLAWGRLFGSSGGGRFGGSRIAAAIGLDGSKAEYPRFLPKVWVWGARRVENVVAKSAE